MESDAKPGAVACATQEAEAGRLSPGVPSQPRQHSEISFQRSGGEQQQHKKTRNTRWLAVLLKVQHEYMIKLVFLFFFFFF
jgi:hypothetical protein